jgi:hypothetical protein
MSTPWVNPTSDPRSIVPRGVPADLARVTTVDFRVRCLAEYDIEYLIDRVRADLFINDQPTGIYSVVRVPENVDVREALHTFGPSLEANVIERFVSAPARVEALEARVRDLSELVDFMMRPKWWHLRRRFRAWKAAR